MTEILTWLMDLLAWTDWTSVQEWIVWAVENIWELLSADLENTATIVIALYTGLLYLENRRLRKAATTNDPHVVVYIKRDLKTGCFLLVIANIGKGIAEDVVVTGTTHGIIPPNLFLPMMTPQSKSERPIDVDSFGSTHKIVEVKITCKGSRGRPINYHYTIAGLDGYLTDD